MQLNLRDIDLDEAAKVAQFCQNGCSCQAKCYKQFSQAHITKMRADMAEFERSSIDMIIMAFTKCYQVNQGHCACLDTRKMSYVTSYGDVQSPLALDGRLCGTPNNISYSPLRQSCLPLISAFRCTNPALTFSSTAQSCFSFLLCIHNGNTVLELSPSFYNRLSLRQSCLPLFSAFGCTNPPLTFSSIWLSLASLFRCASITAVLW